MFHLSYLFTQINLSIVFDFFYSLIFFFDLAYTKALTLLSYSNMVSDLAEGFAVSIILLILIVSGFVVSIKVQEQVKNNNTENSINSIYVFAFRYFNNK